uniref:Uncharacterized protein n=1 Tax=Romanomermis culicivorax TaxID=13658 RepID=A0A915IAX1_ROMCU
MVRPDVHHAARLAHTTTTITKATIFEPFTWLGYSTVGIFLTFVVPKRVIAKLPTVNWTSFGEVSSKAAIVMCVEYPDIWTDILKNGYPDIFTVRKEAKTPPDFGCSWA